MAERYTRKDATAAFNRLIETIGGRIATDYNDVGAYRLDWNATYGGGIIERISNPQGGVSQPFGHMRMNAREFYFAVHLAINAMDEAKRINNVHSN